MTLLDRSQVQILMGEYGSAPARALSDTALLAKAQEQRRLLGARMQALAPEDIRKRITDGNDYHVSRKIDGEFTLLVVRGDEVLTVNPGGTVRVGLPFAAEAKMRLKKAGLTDCLLLGELYVRRPDGKRARVHDVVQVARKPESPEQVQSLHFGVFDILEPSEPTFDRTWPKIAEVFKDGKQIHPVDSTWTKKVDDIMGAFETWVEKEENEGIVVRSDTMGFYKVKPKHTLDVAVVGFAEGVDDRKGMLHDVLVAAIRPDGAFHLLGRVGGGFTDEQRRDMFSDLNDMVVASEYAEVNKDHVAYQMVRPEWVIEMSVLDMIPTTTRGSSIDRMVLTFDGSSWKPARRLPMVNLISPVFVRRREDKTACKEDIGLRQITDIVPVTLVEQDATNVTIPSSTLLRREVCTKQMKGQTMVRKLVLWATNKQDTSQDHPAFVLHLTDYSPNRKTPLDRDIRVSNSRAQMDDFWKEMAAEAFGRGWKQV